MRATLNYLRRNSDCQHSDPDRRPPKKIVRNSQQWLREPWALDDGDVFKDDAVAYLPGIEPEINERAGIRLGPRSALGMFLRSSETIGPANDLKQDEAEALMQAIIRVLRGNVLTVVSRKGEERAVQINGAIHSMDERQW